MRLKGLECIIGSNGQGRVSGETMVDTMSRPFGYKEHRKGKRRSTKEKHQKGKERRRKDRPGGEKGDQRRTRRK
jgi:hypothetical protein